MVKIKVRKIKTRVVGLGATTPIYEIMIGRRVATLQDFGKPYPIPAVYQYKKSAIDGAKKLRKIIGK